MKLRNREAYSDEGIQEMSFFCAKVSDITEGGGD